jgi:hypothetical protein
MQSSKEIKPNIHQLLMGGGKTSFIIPVLALYTILNQESKKTKTGSPIDKKRFYDRFIYVLPTTLVKQSTNIISKYLSQIIPGYVSTFNVTRINL